MMAALRSAMLALVVLTGYSACAQLVTFPDAPSQHRFLDRQNKIAFGTLAGLIAVDGITTQRLVNSGTAHEANPLWRPMVGQGWQGEMAASAMGFSAALGVAYTFHKTGHHKLERWANWIAVGMEAGVDSHNLLLDARR
jgi:hypothetical protein